MRNSAFLFGLIFFASSAFAEGQVWDFLRPATDFANEINFQIKIFIFLFSVAIFAVSFLAYNKSKSKRILLVSFAFALFVLKWLVEILDIYYSPGDFLSESSGNIFDLGIMVSLFIALFYRKSWSNFFAKDEKKG